MKARNRTYVDVLAHSDLSGSATVNQTLSDKRAAAVAARPCPATASPRRGSPRAGYGETAPLYNPETSESEKAANRRVEIRLVPYSRLAALGEEGAQQLRGFLLADPAEDIGPVMAGRLARTSAGR